MCGIAGIVSYGAPPDREVLGRMTRVLAHRGPDEERLFLEGPCGLGFRRLAIIDLVTGAQPMTAGPATVVFNGEIYNYKERRAELEGLGHRFETTSDTEVMLHAYLQWGEEFTPKLDGMFAFAIWDRSQRRLVAGRDRFGKKPFYYLQRGDLFLFGSELKSLLEHPATRRVIDRAALRKYLAFECVPTPHAIFEGVRKLREGHTLRLTETGLREVRYFTLPPAAPEPSRGQRRRRADEAAIGLRERLDAAVRKRLVSDVPLGVFLSGGIDSSAVTALAAAHKPGLKTFSVGFAESSFDESRFAELVARTFGTAHQSEQLSVSACLDLIPQAVDQLDEPLGDASYLPTSLLSQFTRKQVTVALGGDGADELFGGYDSFVGQQLVALYAKLPGAADGLLRLLARALPVSRSYMSLDFRIKTFLAGVHTPDRHRHQSWIGSFTPEAQQELLTPAWRGPSAGPNGPYADLDAFVAGAEEGSLEWALRFYLAFYMKDDVLVKVDRASMAASLEVRTPFLDTEVATYVAGLPTSFKVHGLTRKWLLKRALQGILPQPILTRRKQGFGLPIADWLRGPLRPMMRDLLSPASLRAAGILEPAPVERLMQEHEDGRADHRKQLWTLLMLEQWRRRWRAS